MARIPPPPIMIMKDSVPQGVLNPSRSSKSLLKAGASSQAHGGERAPHHVPGKDTPGPNVALAETLPWHAGLRECKPLPLQQSGDNRTPGPPLAHYASIAHVARVYDYLLGGKDNISQVVSAAPAHDPDISHTGTSSKFFENRILRCPGSVRSLFGCLCPFFRAGVPDSGLTLLTGVGCLAWGLAGVVLAFGGGLAFPLRCRGCGRSGAGPRRSRGRGRRRAGHRRSGSPRRVRRGRSGSTRACTRPGRSGRP